MGINSVAEVIVEPSKRILNIDQNKYELPQSEFSILMELVKCSPHVVTKERLYQIGWPESTVTSASLSVAISSIRKLLDAHGLKNELQTVRKAGYKINAQHFVIKEELNRQQVNKREFSIYQSRKTLMVAMLFLATLIVSGLWWYSSTVERNQFHLYTLSVNERMVLILVKDRAVLSSSTRQFVYQDRFIKGLDDAVTLQRYHMALSYRNFSWYITCLSENKGIHQVIKQDKSLDDILEMPLCTS